MSAYNRSLCSLGSIQLLFHSNEAGGGVFYDKKIRVVPEATGRVTMSDIQTQAVALDKMTETVAPNRISPHPIMTIDEPARHFSIDL